MNDNQSEERTDHANNRRNNIFETNALVEGFQEPETPEGFNPTNAAGIDWVLSKIADANARAKRVRENAEKIAKQHEAEAKFFEWRYGAQMMEFTRTETEGGRRKSVTLLHGTIGFRTQAAKIEISDLDEALFYAQTNVPDAVVTRLDMATLKKAVTLTDNGVIVEGGEIVPWATVVPAEEVFYIK